MAQGAGVSRGSATEQAWIYTQITRVPRAHSLKSRRGSTWQETQTAIKAPNLEGQRPIADLATHALHCFTSLSEFPAALKGVEGHIHRPRQGSDTRDSESSSH